MQLGPEERQVCPCRLGMATLRLQALDRMYYTPLRPLKRSVKRRQQQPSAISYPWHTALAKRRRLDNRPAYLLDVLHSITAPQPSADALQPCPQLPHLLATPLAAFA